MDWIKASWIDFIVLLRRSQAYLIVFGLLATFLLIFELPHMIVVVHSGEAGVLFKVFNKGTITDYLYPEGVHFILPWDTMTIYNTRIQESKEVLSVLTDDGLEVEIDLSIRYHPEPNMIGVLHQTVGPDYVHKVAIPEVESAVRSSVGRMSSELLYMGLTAATVRNALPDLPVGISATPEANATPEATNPRPAATTASSAIQLATAVSSGPPNNTSENGVSLESSIGKSQDLSAVGGDQSLLVAINNAIEQAAKKYVLIDDVLITRIKLPDYVQASIEKKIEQKQIAESQEYLLDQSKTEVEIANNKAAANNALQSGLSESVLRLRGIEATEKLATSPNAKIIVMGNGPNSLPVILGSEK